MEYAPFHIEGSTRPGRWLILCDHAANTVPPQVGGGSLDLSDVEMARHIAWDPGAAGVARALAEVLDAPCLCSNFSRLVIDPNRGVDDPTLLRKIYDGTVIPGNRDADAAERARRIALCYQPYCDAIEDLAARPGTVLISIHSFTHALVGRPPRPWEIGILYADQDPRLSLPLLERLRAHPHNNAPVGENQPYKGSLPGDTLDRHGLQKGRPHTLIELRQDVIVTETQQRGWATRLAPLIEAAAAEAQI